MHYNKIFIILLLLIIYKPGFSQEILTKDTAVALALENNYGIKVANNNVLRAKNNSSIYNSNYLPRVSANAGANYNNSNYDTEFQDGSTSTRDNAAYSVYNASLAVNYTLFDGFGRSYNYKILKETHKLSELEARQIIENTLLQLFIGYYEVARLTEDELNLITFLEISKNRLLRAQYNYEYGQSTKLDILNAEVDLNNDKIKHRNIKKLLANSRHNLNFVLGRDVNTVFEVDTSIAYTPGLILEDLISRTKNDNVFLLQANKNIEISNYQIKVSKSGWMPTVGVSGSYGYNNVANDASFTTANSTIDGFSAGINLSWNIFDGGMTKTRVQNAKISVENSEILKQQTEQSLERDVRNAWEALQNALFVLEAEGKNVETNKRNFARSEEQYKLGQITSIDFRLAQVNLLNAATNLNRAKFDTKIAELALLQVSGQLLNAEF
ncbi:MAG: TolC family protein [Bacteroidetes bacterium]|nr:MAG: TolC family protein [Bacteroidota bacterium]